MPVNRDRGRISDGSDDGKAGAVSAGRGDSGQSSVTLSGLLNAIDGVSSQASLATEEGDPADICIGGFDPIGFYKPPRPT